MHRVGEALESLGLEERAEMEGARRFADCQHGQKPSMVRDLSQGSRVQSNTYSFHPYKDHQQLIT